MAAYEKLNFNYSTKNIPLCNKIEYKIKLMEKIRSFCRRIRIKLYFCTNDEDSTDMIENKETYGFKSKFTPKQPEELKNFENEMFDLINQVKFRKSKDKFQQELQKDLRQIGKTKSLIVPADKTNNYYKIPKLEYDSLLLKSIRKSYKKSDKTVMNEINKEAKEIVTNLKLEKKLVNHLPKQQCYITLKDHKKDFASNPKTRLINPSYSDIGQISKCIIDRINNVLRKSTKYLQWRSSQEVLNWYKKLKKHKYKFMKFDIVEFYPSISEKLLSKALAFAKESTKVSEQEIKIILNASKSVLHNKEEVWVKRKSNTEENELFDITMGGKHGAEICELVGLYILHKLRNALPNLTTGLYRDDGLMVIEKNKSNVDIEKIKKSMHNISKEMGIKLDIENPSRKINYLDLSFNLYNHTFQPYRKENSKIIYINSKSNHPPAILKQIPKMIEERLSKNSSNENLFNEISKDYNDAIKLSGYNYKIKFKDEDDEKKQPRKRKRKIIWFNPPYCKSIKTNIGKKFLQIINKYFGVDSKFKKYLNKNNIKLSYSCLPNIETIIKNHNKKLTNCNKNDEDETCNCRNKEKCPLKGGNCRAKNVIYQATVKTDNATKSYIGLSANQFKKRVATHRTTINSNPEDRNYIQYKQATELSKYIHTLKNENKNYELTWTILEKEYESRPRIETCRLCLKEALKILQADKNCINKRSEVMSSCRHRNKFLLFYWNESKT